MSFSPACPFLLFHGPLKCSIKKLIKLVFKGFHSSKPCPFLMNGQHEGQNFQDQVRAPLIFKLGHCRYVTRRLVGWSRVKRESSLLKNATMVRLTIPNFRLLFFRSDPLSFRKKSLCTLVTFAERKEERK